MDLKSIENQVTREGYHTFYHQARLVVTRFSSKDEITGQILCDFFCYVYFSGNLYVVEHFDGSIPVLEEFSTEAKVIAFIKEYFPL